MQKFVKLLARDLRHHHFQYKEGLNVDFIPFDASGECKPGGLYFTTQFHIGRWICDSWPLAADVTVPPDAQLYQEPCHTKWKADRLVLSNIRPLHQYLKEHAAQCCSASLEIDRQLMVAVTALYRIVLNQDNVSQCLEAIQRSALNLAFIEQQTAEMCALAVRLDGLALRHVKKQTEELCLVAIKNQPESLQYVEEQTDEMCVLAVSLDKSCVQWVKQPSDRMWALF
jgi:hypothetical protein